MKERAKEKKRSKSKIRKKDIQKAKESKSKMKTTRERTFLMKGVSWIRREREREIVGGGGQ